LGNNTGHSKRTIVGGRIIGGNLFRQAFEGEEAIKNFILDGILKHLWSKEKAGNG